MLQLRNDRLSLSLVPSLGGGIARFDWLGHGEAVPLMRPRLSSPGGSPGDNEPNRLACYPLLPWSNRIAHGGFFQGGRRIALARNRDDDPHPIHGSAWQRCWNVRRYDSLAATLELDDDLPGAHRFRATLDYRLDGDTLRVSLHVANRGQMDLPFGMGLHPFLPLHGTARLRAPAPTVWLNDGFDAMPVELAAVPGAWDFTELRALPGGGLNHAFTGWSGHAVVEWPRERVRLHIEADVAGYVLYVPADEDFFCFEPVDHPINAVHLPGGAVANGMTLLAPGDAFERVFVFRAEPLIAGSANDE
jgi:aldose 1-epimerase